MQHPLRPWRSVGCSAALLVLASCAADPSPPQPTAQHPCPQWTAFPADRHSNEEPAYLGCSNAANLRSMAVNPIDLEHGRTLGPGDGGVAARAVAAYRQGKVKFGQSGTSSAGSAAAAPAAGGSTP